MSDERMSIRAVKRKMRHNANLSVPFYFMACYAYYRESNPIMNDDAFDYLCRFIQREWLNIKHRHKRLIERPPGPTAHAVEYPPQTYGALCDWRGTFAHGATRL